MLSRMSSRPKSFRILFLITTKVNLITADMYTTSVFTYELLMKKYIESNLIHKGKKIKVLKFRNSITKKKRTQPAFKQTLSSKVTYGTTTEEVPINTDTAV